MTHSIWMQTAQLPGFAPLRESHETEICIVGGGIAGLSTAYFLVREGKHVTVLDDGPIAGGETERTTAHLSNALDDRYYFLEKKHGAGGARLAAESHTRAIEEIQNICETEQIFCDFDRLAGYLFNPPGVSADELEKELEAAHRAGLDDVTLVERAPLPSFDTGPCLRFPGQAQFHPLKYLRGLVSAIRRMGGEFFSNTHVVDVAPNGEWVDTAGGARVSCGAVVMATNTPVNDRVTMHTKQAAYRSYVIGLRVPGGAVPRALYWDTAQDEKELRKGQSGAYHYVRLQAVPQAGEELLIVGGEDHKTGQADDAEKRWAALEKWTRERFSMAEAVDYRWSGQIIEPVDGLAFIGRNPGVRQQNLYIATGDSGHGMTHGTIAGMLLGDLILARENPWTKLYDPSRKPFRAVGQFARENLNVAAKYGELATRGEIHSVDELPADCGAVMRDGASKVAVYRDDEGRLHEFSAVCPHLGCIVHWNHAEKSWDCPCHGSRFSKYGEVVNGPAISNLEAFSTEPANR